MPHTVNIKIVPIDVIDAEGRVSKRFGLFDKPGEGYFAYHYPSEHDAARVAEKIERLVEERGPGVMTVNFAYGNPFIFAR